jgi:hypothetical protein
VSSSAAKSGRRTDEDIHEENRYCRGACRRRRGWRPRARLSVASHHHHRAVSRRRSDGYARTDLERAHEGLARSACDYRDRDRGRRQHRGCPRRASGPRWLHAQHRELDKPRRGRRDVSSGARRGAGIAADIAHQRHSVDDHRQECVAAAERARPDHMAQGEPGQGVGRNRGRRQRGAYLLALFPAEDRHQFPARAMAARR